MCKQGKLKLEEYGLCNGYFDKDTQVRLGCRFKGDICGAPRLEPWNKHLIDSFHGYGWLVLCKDLILFFILSR